MVTLHLGRVSERVWRAAIHAGVDVLPLIPPPVEAVGQDVARPLRVAEQEPRLVDRHGPAVQFQDAERHQDRLRPHVVVEHLHRLRPAGLAATGEVADRHRRLGIDGDPQRVRVGRGVGSGLVDVGEDGVGLGHLFAAAPSAPGGVCSRGGSGCRRRSGGWAPPRPVRGRPATPRGRPATPRGRPSTPGAAPRSSAAPATRSPRRSGCRSGVR